MTVPFPLAFIFDGILPPQQPGGGWSDAKAYAAWRDGLEGASSAHVEVHAFQHGSGGDAWRELALSLNV